MASIPFSAPSEPDTWTATTGGRVSCESCDEWIYPRRPAGSTTPFALPPACPVCGAHNPRS